MQWMPCTPHTPGYSGLAWIEENHPDLWRLPKRSARSLPDGVRRQMCFPAGACLRMQSDTSEFRLRVHHVEGGASTGLDVYVDGRFWNTIALPTETDGEVVCFAGANRQPKRISVYLPLRDALLVSAYGFDDDTECTGPAPSAGKLPVVLYGSSVAQGIGASRSGMGYSSILGRLTDRDIVNLGFGGAGKAEAEVVSLVAEVDACCYVLGLGKSYGLQPADAYAAMLQSLREAHPDTPVVCITPIFSCREFYSEDYAALSRHTREVVREAVSAQLAQGDTRLSMIDGCSLLSAEETDGFSHDGVHPNDLGHTRIAERLQPAIDSVIAVTQSSVQGG